MNKPIDIRWELDERDVVLECQIVGKYYPQTYLQPAEYPETEIISGEYADGKPLSESDFEKLYEDEKLHDEIFDEYNRIQEGDYDNEVDRLREKLD